ncbi:hypothetical protein KPH14_008733 [Odynerus spinipes]|uniref:Uncharacterized protein n=1 Tax=Odynerus spinipes TaxID=1348599 RepID=A0AAD9VII9_9HYME|nr:hypothetical protein KPH14_008733 [Odynerus spinipes]
MFGQTIGSKGSQSQGPIRRQFGSRLQVLPFMTRLADGPAVSLFFACSLREQPPLTCPSKKLTMATVARSKQLPFNERVPLTEVRKPLLSVRALSSPLAIYQFQVKPSLSDRYHRIKGSLASAPLGEAKRSAAAPKFVEETPNKSQSCGQNM